MRLSEATTITQLTDFLLDTQAVPRDTLVAQAGAALHYVALCCVTKRGYCMPLIRQLRTTNDLAQACAYRDAVQPQKMHKHNLIE
ncbi:MAG: hypothetical protein FD130_300 [Halothiobacillaceae bacterium]|nr:MAG: hypothetical protein FD130_300 [Halothiobacillaceae bacterium]